MPNPQPTVNYTAQNVILYIADPTNLGVVLPVVALNGFQGLGGVKSSIKLSNFDSAGYDEYAPGLVDPGKPSGSIILNYKDSSHQLLQRLLGLGATGSTTFFFGEADSTTAPTAPGGQMTMGQSAALTMTTVTPATATTGGTLAAATYFYKVTAINGSNPVGESLPATEVSQVTSGSTSTVTLTWTAVAGATGYKIYRSTTTNTEVFLTQVGAVLTLVDTGSITPAGASPPVVNTTPGFLRSGWLFNGFVAEFGYQTSTNNVAMMKLTIQATGARKMIVLGANAAI